MSRLAAYNPYSKMADAVLYGGLVALHLDPRYLCNLLNPKTLAGYFSYLPRTYSLVALSVSPTVAILCHSPHSLANKASHHAWRQIVSTRRKMPPNLCATIARRGHTRE